MAESRHSFNAKKYLADIDLSPPFDNISPLLNTTSAKNKWIKFLNDSQMHRTIKYEEGKIVEDTIPFDPSGSCKPGGLYFTDYVNCEIWYNSYGFNKVAYIEFCPDSQVYAESCGTKWKADKFNVVRIGCMWDDEEICMATVKKDGFTLKFVKNQTEKICLAAVKRHGLALEFVKERTEAICMAAVIQNGHALEFVQTQTEVLCNVAVIQNGLALEFVQNQTDAICRAAVNENGLALEFVQNQTDAICIAAVNENGLALEFVQNQTDAICMAAVNENGYALEFVREQTEAICMIAVKQNGLALEYVENQTEELCMAAVEQNIWVLPHVNVAHVKFTDRFFAIQRLKI